MKNHFIKIRLLCHIADAIADFGEQCGYANLTEQTDMNCGAVPDGTFEQIIDPDAPEMFIKLYSDIAKSRLAYAVTQVLKISPECLPPIQQFCYQMGQRNQLEEQVSPADALAFVETVVLDGMPGEKTKEITACTENEVSWRLTKDTHRQFWEKFGGNPEVYDELLKAFVAGLLEKSGCIFCISQDETFSIKRC